MLALPSALSGNLCQSLLSKTSAFYPSKVGGAGQTHSIWISPFELPVESSFYEAVVLC